MSFHNVPTAPASLLGTETQSVQEEGINDASNPLALSNAKEYPSCPTCHQSFKRNEHLERHVRLHTMEKPFVCVVCEMRFSRKCEI